MRLLDIPTLVETIAGGRPAPRLSPLHLYAVIHMMHLGARKTQAKTERAAQNGPGTRDCFRITHGRFYERIGLLSPTET